MAISMLSKKFHRRCTFNLVARLLCPAHQGEATSVQEEDIPELVRVANLINVGLWVDAYNGLSVKSRRRKGRHTMIVLLLPFLV